MRVEKRLVGRSAMLAAMTVLILAGSAWAGQPGKGPVKVFILAGQSNMDGQANVNTIDFLGEDKDKDRAALLKTFKPDGKTLVTRNDVWVVSGNLCGDLGPGYGGRKDYDKLGNNIGPEYAFGYYMGEALKEQVLLIKYGPGGQSLYVNFRPPSAGLPSPMPTKNVVGPDKVKTKVPMTAEDFGEQYRVLIKYTHETLDSLKKHFPTYDEKAGYEIAGFVWFHGFNDQLSETSAKEYGKNLECLIKDLRKEFKAPDMKVVVGVMGVNGVNNEVGRQKITRDAQRSMNTIPEFKGNVKAIESAPLLHPEVVALKTAGWLNKERDLKKNPLTPEEQAMLDRATSNLGFHYYGEGRFFILLGKAMAETMLELMAPAAPTKTVPTSDWQTQETPVYSDPEDNWAKDPSIIKAGDTYYMYYTSANPWQDTGQGGKGEPRIDYATSPDGFTWTRQGVAIEKGKAGQWDDTRPQAPAKPMLKDGVYYMYYAGAGKKVSIGYATSTDLRRWTKNSDNPVIKDMSKSNDPFLYQEDGLYYLFFNDMQERVHYVTSSNLVSWTSEKPVLTGAVGEGNIVIKDQGVYTMLTAVGHSHRGEYYKSWTSRSLTGFVDRGKIKIKVPTWASGAFGHGDVVCRDNQYWLYFQGTSDGGKTFQIGLAKHPARPIGLSNGN